MRARWLAGLFILAAGLFASPGSAAIAQHTHSLIIVGIGDVESGQFLRGVQVRLKSIPIEATTDSMGEARLYGVRPGTYTVEARRPGYQILSAPIVVGGTDSLEVVMLMHVAATRLDTVTVRAQAAAKGLRDFEARRLRGIGQFITQAQIDSAQGASLDAILRTHIRGVSVIGDAGNGIHILNARGSTVGGLNPMDGPVSQCWPVLYLDGMPLPQDTRGGPDISIVATATIAGIQFYSPSEVPAEYRSLGTFSPAAASEQFNPDLMAGGSGARTKAPSGVSSGRAATGDGAPSTRGTTNSWTGATTGLGVPTDRSVTSPTCGVMLIWTRR